MTCRYFILLLAAITLSTVHGASEPTAFDLIKEGNRHVGEEAKGRVVQIRSEKSVGTLVPNIWYVVYYDPDATAKATEVKFTAGRKTAVKRPALILEAFSRSSEELPANKLKIDSDDALKIAVKEPILKHLKLTATRLTLEAWEGQPVWKVRFYASKIKRPDQSADLGEIFVAADNGKVVRVDVQPTKAE